MADRQIIGNVIIAYEILHSFKSKKRGEIGSFALNLIWLKPMIE